MTEALPHRWPPELLSGRKGICVVVVGGGVALVTADARPARVQAGEPGVEARDRRPNRHLPLLQQRSLAPCAAMGEQAAPRRSAAAASRLSVRPPARRRVSQLLHTPHSVSVQRLPRTRRAFADRAASGWPGCTHGRGPSIAETDSTPAGSPPALPRRRRPES